MTVQWFRACFLQLMAKGAIVAYRTRRHALGCGGRFFQGLSLDQWLPALPFRRILAGTGILVSIVGVVASQPLDQRRWAPIPTGSKFESGDAWVSGGKRFRLYGVASCPRGRSFMNASGVRHDCGEASLAMLVSLIRDLNPVCTEVARDESAAISHVICLALPDRGAAKGSRIDLGTALISSGFGFAAKDGSGKPVHREYLIAEEVARRSRAGLWGVGLK